MKSIYIDINCDLGEGVSQQDCALDELLMAYVSSCNIACGGHAGNELTMRESLRNATKNQLKMVFIKGMLKVLFLINYLKIINIFIK